MSILMFIKRWPEKLVILIYLLQCQDVRITRKHLFQKQLLANVPVEHFVIHCLHLLPLFLCELLSPAGVVIVELLPYGGPLRSGHASALQHPRLCVVAHSCREDVVLLHCEFLVLFQREAFQVSRHIGSSVVRSWTKAWDSEHVAHYRLLWQYHRALPIACATQILVSWRLLPADGTSPARSIAIDTLTLYTAADAVHRRSMECQKNCCKC
mmetsp:Transcript_23470/g.41590  ORF Transcript_23470/g.41590 Transcript_23470/m.41590 type:complete len:211 (+) Transcript_23470:101-733(+)